MRRCRRGCTSCCARPARDPRREWWGAELRELDAGRDERWAWKRDPGPRWWAQLADALTAASEALGAADQLRREGALGGVELRHPLRDPELIELALGLPPELSFDAHLDRPLVRRAFAGELPADVLADDRKPAFDSVLSGALAGPDRDALRQLLDAPDPELARRVRTASVESLLSRSAGNEGPPASSPDLWRIATLELWLERQAGSDAPDRLLKNRNPEPNMAFVQR